MNQLKSLCIAAIIGSVYSTQPTFAAIVDTGASTPVTITGLTSYEDFGGGDVVFSITSAVTGCEGGFWLRPTDPGFQRSLAIAMSAQLGGRSVRIAAHNDSLWPGSGAKYCRIYNIGLF
jgi:hypothetical protein